MHDKYILNEKGEPVVEPDLLTWGRWLQDHDDLRIVKQEWIENVRVSTVFLGLDYNWRLRGPPVLWETMTFSNSKKCHYEQDRCAGSREQAMAMHQRMVERVKLSIQGTKPKGH